MNGTIEAARRVSGILRERAQSPPLPENEALDDTFCAMQIASALEVRLDRLHQGDGSILYTIGRRGFRDVAGMWVAAHGLACEAMDLHGIEP